MPSVSVISLGCAKNLVDSEVMLAKLGAADWAIEPDPERADAVIVNTCAFIDPAKAESTERILEQAQRKRPGQHLIVAGCLAQRYGEQLQQLVPEIDGIVGTGAYASIAEILEGARSGARPVRTDYVEEPEHAFLPRLVTTPPATAYLKIAEGCDHPCTFCVIPALRGAFRSRSEASILSEARALAEGGVKELVLIAQDTSMWGRDRGIRRGGLAMLLQRLHAVDGLEWIRLLYLYPATVDDELVDAIASLPKICKYMDMPLQHAHPDVLRAMRRPSNGERYLEILDAFRRKIPGVTMRSTFIVGFPGEREEHVAYLEEWLGRAQLDRVGFFAYSAEEGTPAATLAQSVPSLERRRRLVRLRDAQRRAAEGARSARGGNVVRVRAEPRRALRAGNPLRARLGCTSAWYGRSEGEAPGVDGGIYFTGEARTGTFVEVAIEGHATFDSFGRVCSGEVVARE